MGYPVECFDLKSYDVYKKKIVLFHECEKFVGQYFFLKSLRRQAEY